MRFHVPRQMFPLEVLTFTQAATEISLTGVRFLMSNEAVSLEEIFLTLVASILWRLVVNLMRFEAFVGAESFIAMLARESLD